MPAMPEGGGAVHVGGNGEHRTDPRLYTVAAAVHATAAVRRLAADLGARNVPLMVLRGPPVQLRLLGDDSAYRSADVDLLVPARHRRRVFTLLDEGGWAFAADNGVLWRLDRAAAFTRSGITVDLHWGVHANTVSARRLGRLEKALWANAILTADGWYEPLVEPLLVYLAVHGAASAFHKPESLLLVRAAAELVTDWAAVERLARAAHVSTSVRHALATARGGPTGPPPPLFDGRFRQELSSAARRMRAELSRPGFRAALRAVRRRRSKAGEP
jgi:hypothetical protein